MLQARWLPCELDVLLAFSLGAYLIRPRSHIISIDIIITKQTVSCIITDQTLLRRQLEQVGPPLYQLDQLGPNNNLGRI